MRVAFRRGVPPAGWRGAGDLGGGLVGMEPETSESVGVDTDVEPTVPVAVSADAAGQTALDLVQAEGHPVDAAVAQSSADSLHRAGAARQILVGRDGDPVVDRRVHGVHDAGDGTQLS